MKIEFANCDYWSAAAVDGKLIHRAHTLEEWDIMNILRAAGVINVEGYGLADVLQNAGHEVIVHDFYEKDEFGEPLGYDEWERRFS